MTAHDRIVHGEPEGRVTISHTTSTGPGYSRVYATVTIRHDGRDIEAALSLEDFGRALIGEARVPAATRSWPIRGSRRDDAALLAEARRLVTEQKADVDADDTATLDRLLALLTEEDTDG